MHPPTANSPGKGARNQMRQYNDIFFCTPEEENPYSPAKSHHSPMRVRSPNTSHTQMSMDDTQFVMGSIKSTLPPAGRGSHMGEYQVAPPTGQNMGNLYIPTSLMHNEEHKKPKKKKKCKRKNTMPVSNPEKMIIDEDSSNMSMADDDFSEVVLQAPEEY